MRRLLIIGCLVGLGWLAWLLWSKPAAVPQAGEDVARHRQAIEGLLRADGKDEAAGATFLCLHGGRFQESGGDKSSRPETGTCVTTISVTVHAFSPEPAA